MNEDQYTQEDIQRMGYDHTAMCCELTWRPAIDKYWEDLPIGADVQWKNHESQIEEVIKKAGYESEEGDRDFSPFEYTAKELNDLDEVVSWDPWEAFNKGVAQNINEWWEVNKGYVANYWEASIFLS
jgi:hypothetical protein